MMIDFSDHFLDLKDVFNPRRFISEFLYHHLYHTLTKKLFHSNLRWRYSYSYYPEQTPNMDRENNYTPGNELFNEETDGGKSNDSTESSQASSIG